MAIKDWKKVKGYAWYNRVALKNKIIFKDNQ